MFNRRNSSLLELEAADYFKLDTSQVNLLIKSNQRLHNSQQCSNLKNPSVGDHHQSFYAHQTNSGERKQVVSQKSFKRNQTIFSRGGITSTTPFEQPPNKYLNHSSNAQVRTTRRSCQHSELIDQMTTSTAGQQRHQGRSSKERANVAGLPSSTRYEPRQKLARSRYENMNQSYKRPMFSPNEEPQVFAASPYLANSSTTSTNSLPSISSSPSVSPSLVCPHLSLDDILSLQREGAKSAHTIGLCAKCRLVPPPNVHSPLSPAFKPSKAYLATHHNLHQHQYLARYDLRGNNDGRRKPNQVMRRGYSDHQVGQRKRASSREGEERSKQVSCSNLRDDSLDCCLEPRELERLQLSPTLRHSVEYIRKNSIEAGRVLKIYKNGQPFDKPLRICITRGEFANLNNLLDYINSRQLIPLGARYLFHLDGQLVYSVHELKHGSAYVVSGTRNFDVQASNILKELHRKDFIRQHLPSSSYKQNEVQKQASYFDYKRAVLFRSSSDFESKQHRTQAQRDTRELSSSVTPKLSPLARRRPQEEFVRKEELKTSLSNKPKVVDLQNKQKAAHYEAEQPSRGTKMVLNELEGADNVEERGSDSVTMSRSDENLTIDRNSNGESERPTNLVRAKSEMTVGPNKRKKNVTFLDTGRGSSPLVSSRLNSPKVKPAKVEIQLSEPTHAKQAYETPDQVSSTQVTYPDKSSIRGLRTNEIGIQVSDSIEGFLIDLPLPVPARREREEEKRVRYLKKGSGSQASGRVGVYTKSPTRKTSSTSSTSSPKRTKTTTTTTTSKRAMRPKAANNQPNRRQIVTISERQLSLEEMDHFKDLDHGNHHNESHKIRHVTIMLESVDDSNKNDERQLLTSSEVKETQTEKGPHWEGDKTGSSELETDRYEQADKRSGQDKAAGEKHWEYPGRVVSATPTERPVSQSEANQAVHARVSTPTPSLSTIDNQSLSHESASLATRSESRVASIDGELILAARTKVPVIGTLRNGINPPSSNFKLVWVNGFAINNQYPENSTTALGAQSVLDASSPTSSLTAATGKLQHSVSSDRIETQLLSPSNSSNRLKHGTSNQNILVFQPNERFHNWICYSNKYDELIYPAGNLVVLWCRWTNEQRHYSKHKSNVSCISLASLDEDLVGSAQVADSSENLNARIHLWSLSSLDTLLVMDQDHFKWRKIYSLKVRNTFSDGCELSIGAKDDKKLYQYVINVRLNEPSSEEQGEVKKSTPSKSKQQVAGKQVTVIKSDKALQANQIPMLVMKMSNERPPEVASTKTGPDKAQSSKATSREQLPLNGLILSFGRRHFQIWATDRRQEKLRLLQSEHKSGQFVETVVKANCLARMSPNEYIVGDSDGNVSLLTINCKSSGEQANKQHLLGSDSSVQKYRTETVLLFRTSSSEDGRSAPSPSPSRPVSITCLARISGNLFASSDSTCTFKIWRINRRKEAASEQIQQQQQPETIASANESNAVMKMSSSAQIITCKLVSCVSLPRDLGFICSIVLARYNRKQALVDFYIASTSNAILFGSVRLDANSIGATNEANTPTNQLSSFSVVYEGHESSVSNLVADYPSKTRRKSSSPLALSETEFGEYFTCSLDCKICKWSGKNLIWKSMLPSACASLAVHPIGFVLAIGSADGTVYILDKISGLLISYFPLTPVCINCLAYSRDGMFLAAGCANGSIFILPVYERGLKYMKVSIFQSPYPVVSLQFSLDNQYILTSVTHSSFQELILWDLPNFRYMRDNVKMAADKIQWFDPICSGSEDVRAIWENENIAYINEATNSEIILSKRKQANKRRLSTTSTSSFTDSTTQVVNLSCHRLIRNQMKDPKQLAQISEEAERKNFAIASDAHGYIRLFRYPCYDIQQGFYEARISSAAVNCCRFLSARDSNTDKCMFVSSSIDGSICLWTLIPEN